MIRHSFFILGVLLGLLPAMAADQGELRGTVIDAETDEPIVGVIVRAIGSNGKAVAFTSTTSTGTFTLKMKPSAAAIAFRCLGYENMKLPLTHDFGKTVRMKPQTTLLKDVLIKAPDIYAKGDTLVFNVERYANAKDDAIIDVIKRLPGITVEKDGTIKYQGKPINKFYLDGNDFLGGQYGLATENISHKDVKSVEVMENHQPIKALEGLEFPEEAGINLKLKDDAKRKWVGVAKTAAGYAPLLYDGSLYAMRLATKVQNIVSLRGGNTGWNPAAQITEHDFLDMFSSDYDESQWPEYISADIASAPLTDKRTRDNLSWIANTISAWKRGDNSMRLKLNYAGERLDYNSGHSTDYMDASIPDFVQRNAMRTQSHDLSAQFNSEINKRGYFFKDKLTAEAVWDDAKSIIGGTENLCQNVSRKSICTKNDLKLVKRNDKKLFELMSRNSVVHSPNSLVISENGRISQNLGITDFRSTTESKYGKLTRFWKFYLNGGLDLNYHRMNAVLSGIRDFDNSTALNSFLSNIYASPQMDYERNNWRVSLTAPLKWRHYSLQGQHDYLNISPSLSVRKKTSAKSEFIGTVAYRLSAPPAYTNLTTPILADYRNLFIGIDKGKYSQGASGSFTYRYRNPLNALFLNLSAKYTYTRSALMTNQLFIDNIIISTFADRISDSNTWLFTGGVSKGLGHSKMVVGCDFNASVSSASSMRDNAINPYKQICAGVKPYFRGSIVRLLSLNYEADYNYSRLKVGNASNSYHSLNQNLYITAIPADWLQFTIGAEHFLTYIPEGNTANMILIDASAVWQLNKGIRITLTANNLLDKRRYEYVSYGTLSRTEHSFSIRPREILAAVQFRF